MIKRAGTTLVLILVVTVAGFVPAAAARGHKHRRNHVTSGVRGTVTAGPVCPVQMDPPDPSCADRPIAAQLTLSRGSQGGGVVARGSSGADGTFMIRVAPGHYTLSATSRDAMQCTPQPVDVGPDDFTGVLVHCDTGIR